LNGVLQSCRVCSAARALLGLVLGLTAGVNLWGFAGLYNKHENVGPAVHIAMLQLVSIGVSCISPCCKMQVGPATIMSCIAPHTCACNE
jgi:hypothetical protein